MRDSLIKNSFLHLEVAFGVFVELVIGLVRIKIVEAAQSKEMPVSRIDKSPNTPEERYNDLQGSPVPGNPVQFLHNFDDIIEMLDGVIYIYIIEFVVIKGVRKDIQVMNDIGICLLRDIHTDSARSLAFAAT
jgi:hypothetical protein